MKTVIPNIPAHTRRSFSQRVAFSLTEILIVVSLLSIIVLGLMAMFSQTQRAFRVGTTQTDVLEGGRAAMDLITRELSQLSPTPTGTNLYVEAEPPYLLVSPFVMPGTDGLRKNMVQQMFFITRENQMWTGTGYLVSTQLNQGVGTLWRFQMKTPVGNGGRDFTGNYQGNTNDPYYLFYQYQRALSNQFNPSANGLLSPVVDGVVSFRIRAYDTNGAWITNNLPLNKPFSNITVLTIVTNFPSGSPTNPPVMEVVSYRFRSNTVPAAVDIELGLAEPPTVRKYRALPYNMSQPMSAQAPVTKNFWTTNFVGHTHLFRQRVAIRNLNPEGYQ